MIDDLFLTICFVFFFFFSKQVASVDGQIFAFKNKNVYLKILLKFKFFKNQFECFAKNSTTAECPFLAAYFTARKL